MDCSFQMAHGNKSNDSDTKVRQLNREAKEEGSLKSSLTSKNISRRNTYLKFAIIIICIFINVTTNWNFQEVWYLNQNQNIEFSEEVSLMKHCQLLKVNPPAIYNSFFWPDCWPNDLFWTLTRFPRPHITPLPPAVDTQG